LLTILFSSLFFQNCSRQPFRVNDQADLSKSDTAGTTTTPVGHANVVVLNPPKAFGSENQINITFSLEPSNEEIGHKAFRCRLDAQSWEKCVSPLIISEIRDGAHTLVIKAIDETTGQESLPKEIAWVVDTQRPIIQLNQTPPSLTAATTAKFLFSSIDVLSGIHMTECSLDGAEWKECVSPLLLEGLTPGAHSLHLRATDIAHLQSLETVVEWKVDPMSQSIKFISTPPSYQATQQATFEFDLIPKTSTATTFECRLSTESQFTICPGIITYNNLSDGNYVFLVRAKSDQGLILGETSHSFMIDSIAPQLTIVSPQNESDVFVNLHVVSNADDGNGSGIATYECQLNGAGFKPCAAMNDLTDQLSGHYDLRVRAKDRAGNYSAIAAASFYFIKVPPTVEFAIASDTIAKSSLGYGAPYSVAIIVHGDLVKEASVDVVAVGDEAQSGVAKGPTTPNPQRQNILYNRFDWDYRFKSPMKQVFTSVEFSKAFQIIFSDDLRDDVNKTLTLKLTNVSGGLTLGSNSQVVLTLPDYNEPAPSSEVTFAKLMTSNGGILSTKCQICHNSVDKQANFDLADYQGMVNRGIIIPGRSDLSAHKLYVRSSPDSGSAYALAPMPLSGYLERTYLDAIEKWLLAGAKNN
jgi:hypothetical protein